MPSTARTTPSRVWNDVRRPLDLEQRPVAALRFGGRRADAGTSSSMTVSSRLTAKRLGRDVARRSSVQPRVERVAQAVAEEVEAEDGRA